MFTHVVSIRRTDSKDEYAVTIPSNFSLSLKHLLVLAEKIKFHAPVLGEDNNGSEARIYF
jgi:hypothetical protein